MFSSPTGFRANSAERAQAISNDSERRSPLVHLSSPVLNRKTVLTTARPRSAEVRRVPCCEEFSRSRESSQGSIRSESSPLRPLRHRPRRLEVAEPKENGKALRSILTSPGPRPLTWKARNVLSRLDMIKVYLPSFDTLIFPFFSFIIIMV